MHRPLDLGTCRSRESEFAAWGSLLLKVSLGGLSRNVLFLEQTSTPGWPPGPVWIQKRLFTSRNERSLEQTWTLGWAHGPVWTPKKAAHIQK